MQLKEILDMEEYLAHRCYCSGEIYSSDGFFYQIFRADSECILIGKNDTYYAVIAEPEIFNDDASETPTAQIILIYKSSKNPEMVADTIRYDATENNIKLLLDLFGGKTVTELKAEGRGIDEYVKGSTKKALNEILSMADAIMISNK